MKRKTIFLVLVGIAAMVIAASAVYEGRRIALRIVEEKKMLERRKQAWGALQEEVFREINGFKGQTGIVVKDLKTGWEITFHEDDLFPAASVVKIPIMAAYFQAAAERRIDFKQQIQLRERQKVNGSGVLKNTPAGTALSIGDLIVLMITQSDNTAANILINLLGFDSLNKYFTQLGLKDTSLVRRMMDFRLRRQGIENYTSASDCALLLEKFYRKGFLNAAVSQQCLDILELQKINDRIPARLPDNVRIAHKTGLERGVCHDVGIVFTPRGDFLICALTRHVPPARPAKIFIATIAKAVYDYYNNY